MSNKNKTQKINFSKNIFTSLVIPAFVLVVALVVGIIFGFNKGLDFNGGIIVSIVADSQNLEVAKEYNSFVGEVNSVLSENNVSSASYLLEKDSTTYKDILVVKISYSGSEEDSSKLVENLKSDFVSKFYSNTSESEIELRNLVNVSSFGSSVDNLNIVSTILATLVVILLICIYVGLRTMSMHTAILTFLSSVMSSILTLALILLTRIQIYAYTLAIIPFASIISAMMAFAFIKKTKELLKTGNYERKANNILSDDAVKQNLKPTLIIASIACVASLLFTFINITNVSTYMGLSVFVSVIALVYVNLFIIPAIFALTYVRRIKKERAKKESKIEASLQESEVLKETDLDNLVSN